MQRHYYAEYYAMEHTHWWFRARRRIIRAILRQEGLWARGLRILDVGAGTGRMLEFLGEGMIVTGIDSESEALGFAAKRGAARLLQSDAVALPIRNASVDVVSAFDIIEHLRDDRAALEEFRRVLKPGGHCVVTAPALRWLWSEHDEINLHLRRYRRAELRRRFEEAGFQVRRCSYFNTLLFAPIAAVRIGRRLLGAVAHGSPRRYEKRLRSDLSMAGSPSVGKVLERVMGFEAELVRRFDLPVGVSLLCVARRGDTGDGAGAPSRLDKVGSGLV